jgi:hypothetical protein
MDDRQIIEKITLLKSIAPRQDWALSAKNQILAHVDNLTESRILQGGVASRILGELASGFRYLEKPAFAFAGLMLLVGTGLVVQLSAGSLPGDILYSVKSMREQTQLAFSPSQDRALVQLQLARLRLDELKQVTQQNRTKDLAAAIKGYKDQVSQVFQAMPGLIQQKPQTALAVGRTILALQKERSELEQALGTSIGDDENADLKEATRLVVESELKDLATRTLNEEQTALVAEAVKASEAGNYDTALEFLLKVGPVQGGETST